MFGGMEVYMKRRCMAGLLAFFLLFSVIGLTPIVTFAAGTVEIFDDLEEGKALFDADLSVVDNIKYATSKNAGYSNLTRICKVSHDGDLDTNTYITYKSTNAMLSFEAVIEQRKCKGNNTVPGDYKFETSKDGVTFQTFNGFEVTLDKSNWNKDTWKEGTVSSVNALPEDTHYLRIYFPGTAHMQDRDVVAAQFGSVKIICKELGSAADLAELAAKVQTTLDNAEVGDKTGQYTQTVVDALQAELDAVLDILQDVASYTPEQRQQAMDALSAALDTFLASANPPSTAGDPCNTTDVAYWIDAGIVVTGDNAADFGGDSGRFVRESDMTGGSIIYRAGDMSTFTSFEVEAWYQMLMGNVADDITIEAAAIGADPDNDTSFQPVTVKKVQNDAGWQEGEWRKTVFTVSSLPEGTEYVRVTFGDSSATDEPGSLQIGNIEWSVNDDGMRAALLALVVSAEQAVQKSISSPGMHTTEQVTAMQAEVDAARAVLNGAPSADDLSACYNELYAALQEFNNSAATPTRIVDECADFTKLYGYSSKDVGLAATSPEKFQGDGTRFSRSSSQKGEYVIYAASENKQMTYFQINAWYNKYSNKIPGDMKLEAAPIGSDPELDTSYTVVDTVKTIDNGDSWPNDAWRMQHYVAAQLPANTKYVRVTFGDSSNTGKSWTIQLGSLEWEEADADYRTVLLPFINQAADLLNSHIVGNQPGNVPESAYQQLQDAKTTADGLYINIAATQEELNAAVEELKTAIAAFEASILCVLNWPEGAVLTTSNLAETTLTLYWPEVLEKDAGGVTYEVYQGDKLLGTTATNSYTIHNLSQGASYAYHVIAKKGSDESKVLGPVTIQTLRYGDMKPPDFSKISPDDFKDEDYMAPLVWGGDVRGVPYYYYNLHKVLNGVVMDGPNKGYVDIYVVRQRSVLKTFNPRVQEVYLPITYFYSRNDDWNEYYGNEEVKERLEAIIEHTLSLQFKDENRYGAWPEYSSTTGSLPGTSFTVNYLGQAMRLLREAKKADPDFPSIDQDLFDRADQAIRAGIIRVLTSSSMWNTGKQYSNQYGLIWSAALAYLEYHPDDTEMIEAFDKRWAQSGELISPAGFYYENSGLDMPYNLGVHTQNIAAEYHYMRGTKYEKDLIEHQSRFFDWLSYNFLVEPDGSFVTVNAAASERSEPSSVVMWRKDFPLAEKIPIARAFVRSDADVEDEIRRNKEAMAKNGAWPILPEMTTTGGSQYNPYSIYNRILYQYFPTDAERQEAIEMLPYNAREYFTQQRSDREHTFSFVKRPEYYAIFNDGPRAVNSQCFGLGAVWTPEGGTFLANMGEKKDTSDNVPNFPIALNYAWGTKGHKTPLSQDYYRVYENTTKFSIPMEYTLNGKRHMPAGAINELPEGDLSISYELREQTDAKTLKGDKTVTFTDDGINVQVNHHGKFQECFPIMMRPEDKVEMFTNRFRIVRGRAVFEIIFNKEVEFDLRALNYKNQRATLNQLTAETYDELNYTITAYTREPELREPTSMVQVEMNQAADGTTSAATTPTTSTTPVETAPPASATQKPAGVIASDTPVSWKDLNLNGDVSRAQYAAAVVDALGMIGDPTKFKEFVDVPQDAWYREHILTAVQLGLIVGEDDTHFAPEQIISKEHRELILERAREFLTSKLSMVSNMMNQVLDVK